MTDMIKLAPSANEALTEIFTERMFAARDRLRTCIDNLRKAAAKDYRPNPTDELTSTLTSACAWIDVLGLVASHIDDGDFVNLHSMALAHVLERSGADNPDIKDVWRAVVVEINRYVEKYDGQGRIIL